LRKLELAGRMVAWSIELSDFIMELPITPLKEES